jgi:hypothetical protein
VRRERLREGQFESHDFLWSIRVLLTALITTDGKKPDDSRWRGDSIRLAERDFVTEQHIGMAMKLFVLADHHPAVARLIPKALRGHEYGTPFIESRSLSWNAAREHALDTLVADGLSPGTRRG